MHINVNYLYDDYKTPPGLFPLHKVTEHGENSL